MTSTSRFTFQASGGLLHPFQVVVGDNLFFRLNTLALISQRDAARASRSALKHFRVSLCACTNLHSTKFSKCIAIHTSYLAFTTFAKDYFFPITYGHSVMVLDKYVLFLNVRSYTRKFSKSPIGSKIG